MCCGAYAKSWDVAKVWLKNKLLVGKKDLRLERDGDFLLPATTSQKNHNSRKYFDSAKNRGILLYEFTSFFFLTLTIAYVEGVGCVYLHVCIFLFLLWYWLSNSHCLIPLQILKLYAWESSYQKKIIKIREQELEVQKSAGYLAVFSMLTLTCIPFLVSVYNISHFDFQIRFVDSPPSYLELRRPKWNVLYLK